MRNSAPCFRWDVRAADTCELDLRQNEKYGGRHS